jgi:hypothetical protein
MTVRLTVVFTEQSKVRWQEEIEKALGLQSTQMAAHDEHREVFFFHAANRAHAESIEQSIRKLKSTDLISHLEGVGSVSYEVAII